MGVYSTNPVREESDGRAETVGEVPYGGEIRPAGASAGWKPWQHFKKTMFRREAFLVWTAFGVMAGVALGAALYGQHPSRIVVTIIGYPGELMIRSLQLMILPLMTFALMSGIFSLRGTKTGSGRVVTWSLCYYLLSMIIAIVIGIVMVYSVKPGRGSPFAGDDGNSSCRSKNYRIVNATQSSTGSNITAVDSLLNLGRDLVPPNVVQAAALPNYLGVMMFAILFAIFLVRSGDKAEPIINGVEICNQVVMDIIGVIILTVPVGVASWIASTILTACHLGRVMESLALFVVTVLSGLAIHVLLALPLTVLLLTRRNPFRAMRSWLPAFAMALGTSSSAATMPLSMQCGKQHGCNPAIVNFVIPLGTNVNRDGTALYEAVAVIFMCQGHGRDLNVGEVIVIVIVATLAAMGTASIPHAGLVTLITALQATGNQAYIGDLSLLYATDWILGMFRTLTNVWGDACACCIVNTLAENHAKKELSELETQGSLSQRFDDDGRHDPEAAL